MPPPVAAAPARRPADDVAPGLLDAVFAAAMAVVLAVVMAADLEGTGRAGAGAYLFAAGFGALLLLRRRLPRLVLAVTILGIFVYYTLGLPPIGIALPAVAALYSAAEAGRTRFAIAAAAVLISVAAYSRVEEGLPNSYLVSYDLLTDVALAAAAIALGVSVRARRDARAHQEQLRALTAAEERRETERRLQAEKAGIARDLHDTIGHTLSVIAVHGNVAAEALGRDDAAAARAVEQIRSAVSSTLRELRTTVKVLRSPASDSPERTERTERTSLGLAGLPSLIAQAENAGVQVAVELDTAGAQLDSAVEAAAYRIVQESLTNVLRHSGACRAAVTVRYREELLELRITDDGGAAGESGLGSPAPSRAEPSDDTPPAAGPRPAAATPAAATAQEGRGIQGMAERAGLLGGTFTAGSRPGGGFEVRATLPGRLAP